MPEWLEAGLWGLLAGSALLIGAVAGFFARVPRRIIASVMAFGAGVLLSAVSFELIAEAHEQGGLLPTAIGAGAGALAYTGANVLLARRGARHRKRAGDEQPSEQEQPGSGTAIAVGALLDGIPESVVIGASLLTGGPVSLVTVIAVFLSNVPEGLSSAAGMRQAGRTRRTSSCSGRRSPWSAARRRWPATRCSAGPHRRCWPPSPRWRPARSSR